MPLAETPLDVLVIATSSRRRGNRRRRDHRPLCPRPAFASGILDLTDGEPTPHGSPERRAAETVAASKPLGLAWRKNLGLPNRSLQDTLEARRLLAGVLRHDAARVILFARYWDDSHPDHVAASRLCEDARFWAKLTRSDLPGEPFWPPRLFYYWSIHLRIHPKPAFVLDISDCHRAEDGSRCALTPSQFVEGRPPVFPTPLDDIRDRARYWGWTIGTAYGEPFGSREEIGLKGLDGIVV